MTGAMDSQKETIIELVRKKKNAYLSNRLQLECTCGYAEAPTLYSILVSGGFEIMEPISTISPFVAEFIYDETITVTPIKVVKPCPKCGSNIEADFPLSVESLQTMLQTGPPDPAMYC